ncbi:hypothetical protein MPH_02350 [Macrophomina phaseolina MS6]|uniref:Uncharacterized protein n=1 Tax=Macrophomina phaseolina (strain MS6) TaxID=1126212 RepID=K2RCS9_MACPH|nr:hypothetical protein MPH_02350 [Macrophomina phaseolina MS6]
MGPIALFWEQTFFSLLLEPGTAADFEREAQNTLAFVRFDELWGGCAEPINFAFKYQEYIKELLQDNIASIQAHVSGVSSTLVKYATTTVENKPDGLNSYGKAIRALEKAYAPVSSESAASAASASSASAASASSASAAAAAASNTANCYLWSYASLAYSIQVTPIDKWAGADGALTSWEFGSWSNGTQWATFNLPTLIKAGCVERAIKSAGGPAGLQCEGMGFFDGFIQEDGSIGEAVAEMPEDVDIGLLGGAGGLGTNKVFAVADDGEGASAKVVAGPHGLPPAPEPTAGMLPLAVPQ